MKTGIVLEGGASRTFYSCGVMDAFVKEDIYPDYLIGVSAGIAYGVSYCSRQYGRNTDIMIKYMKSGRYMGMRNMLRPHNHSYYNLDFVFGEIPNKLVPFSYDNFNEFKGDIIAVVTDIETGEAVYLDYDRADKDFNMLRASCALPILFRPIEINGHKYLDGGIVDSIPFQRALDDGCDRVVVVLTRTRDYVKTHEKSTDLAAFIYRKYPVLANALKIRHEMYNKQLRDLFELEKQGRVIVIAPETTRGVGRTERSPEVLLPLYNDGLRDGAAYAKRVREYWELG